MNYNVIIVGAGIVGLATAYNTLMKKPGINLLVIEKEPEVAKHQTGNNSGVIHSGIYYKPGSLKATNCRRGYDMLLKFCNENNIQYDICGKVIVATSKNEIQELEKIYNRGSENGLSGLKILSAEELKEHEPNVNGVKGILVPQTGIIDFKQVSEKLAGLIKEAGGEVLLGTELSNIKSVSKKILVETNNGSFECDFLITCAGLQSDRIASLTHPKLDVRIIPFRGEYYKLKPTKRSLVNNLIYPVPDPAFPFLGVHFTRMINGDVECGPNAVLSFKREGYGKIGFSLKDSFDTFSWSGFLNVAKKYWRVGMGEFYRSYSKRAFVKALQKLVPGIEADDLAPGGSGVRAQACHKNGTLLDDFYFIEDENIIHVLNAPSPAATSALSIGEYIAEKASVRLN